MARGTQGRAIFNHVKIALRKIVRTLPTNFKALLNHSPHHILKQDEKFPPLHPGIEMQGVTISFSSPGANSAIKLGGAPNKWYRPNFFTFSPAL